MKKILIIATALVLNLQLILSNAAQAQEHYWVMLTDKAGTTFDPYSHFDPKAIERYQLNHADLYDISNYPLNESYVNQIDAIATEDFGQSRWLNAVAVTATPEQIEAIRQLPFVKEVALLEGNMQLTQQDETDWVAQLNNDCNSVTWNHSDQIVRMGVKYFRDKGINGKGVRIAVFDGGFPQVNTHKVFQHLRDNGQIVKTWNFPNKKEDVYGWNSHGLMTLSCIAGINQYQGSESVVNMDLGLATGAEFLLARTEVNTEPFKEEVWWMMAVEWADKNGAQIISSSLGYGKDRYFTKDMNGQSYVAKAGNMAARKGILVCNSAGNEGDDNTWRTIITPSDADSVLCVGGIVNSLRWYDHINFSSYGPSADGRQKPNVCAFGTATTANTGSSNDETHYVSGTSFSCPLVAGFAACALQAHPELTAMQLFHEIEKSADLYPYCDYSYGYGVPQADYFTGDRKKVEPSFKFEKRSDLRMSIVPLTDNPDQCHVFIKNSQPDGTIIDYQKIELDSFTTDMRIDICYGEIVTAHYNGYTESYNSNPEGYASCNPLDDHTMHIEIGKNGDSATYTPGYSTQHFSTRLNEKHTHWGLYFMLGLPVNTDDAEMDHSLWSPAKRLGIRWTYHFSKSYGWGFGLEYGHVSYRLGDKIGSVDEIMYTDVMVDAMYKDLTKHHINVGELGVELYQRVRIVPGGIFHKGWHWDLGVYGSFCYNSYILRGTFKGDYGDHLSFRLRNITALDDYRWNWGVTTRISRDWLGLYARYRLTRIGKDVATGQLLPPRLEVGLQLAL
ncbi:MAG: S8 family serine peptidase [Bacteroidales bacterium]|nr:S8 family serine peptidase [Bacteroidales bacterium]